MIAVQLLRADEYLPKLEKIGLEYVETVDLEDVPHTVFQTPKGTRFMYPGVRGSDNEIPMIPALRLNALIKAAQDFMNRESDPIQHNIDQN